MGFFTDLLDGLQQQWKAEAAQQTPEQVAAMRAKGAKDFRLFYNLDLPYSAQQLFDENTPTIDKLQGADPAVKRLLSVLGTRGYDNILSEYPQVSAIPSSEVEAAGAKGIYRRNPFSGQQRIGVRPTAADTELTTTLLHEIIHALQDNPETEELLKYHRLNVQKPHHEADLTQEDIDFNRKYPAIAKHSAAYMSDLEEVQARGLASAMLSDLLGVPEGALKDAPHTLLLNQLLGRGYSPTPLGVAKRPERF